MIQKRKDSPEVHEAIQYRVPIKEWPEDDRPREKLSRLGAQALSDAELLAILLGSGTRNATAVDVAKYLLKQHESLHQLARYGVAEFQRIKGIGTVRAITLAAAFELARRLHRPEKVSKPVFLSPADVASYMIPRLRDLRKEIFVVLLLNSANRLIREVTISEGNLNSSVVHPREVFKAALDELAAGIILVHNHPSGRLQPSQEDISITRQLVEAGRIVGIPVHDHVLTAGSEYVSFAEQGLLGSTQHH